MIMVQALIRLGLSNFHYLANISSRFCIPDLISFPYIDSSESHALGSQSS